jgi:acyl carrier protein
MDSLPPFDASLFDTPFAQSVARAFSLAFPGEEITPDSNFFTLGGDSLKAVEICLAIEDHTQTDVHPSVLLYNPTAGALIAAVSPDVTT